MRCVLVLAVPSGRAMLSLLRSLTTGVGSRREGLAPLAIFFGSSEELVGKKAAHLRKSFGLEPLGNLNNKAWGWLSVMELDRLRRPFIRRGHALRRG